MLLMLMLLCGVFFCEDRVLEEEVQILTKTKPKVQHFVFFKKTIFFLFYSIFVGFFFVFVFFWTRIV